MTKPTIKRNSLDRLIWGLLAVLAILTLLPLLHSGLTNSDSIIFFHTARSLQDASSLFGMGHQLFQHQGRLTHLLTGWCLYFPYVTHSRFVFLLLTILPIVLDILLSILLVRRYTHNESATQLAALVLLCVFTIHTGFSATIGYPFWFSFSFAILLVSLLFLLRYRDTQKYRLLLLSAIFMLWATTFYEAYLVYYVIIYLILRSQYGTSPYRDKTSRQKFFRELLPFVLLGLLFVAAYLILASAVSSSYTGTKWSFSPIDTLRSWGNLILYTIPGMSFYQYRIPLADLTPDPQFKYSFFYIFTHTGATAWAKGLLAMLALYGILSVLDIKTNSRRLWHALLIAVLAVILPHLILSLTSKYAQDIPDIYITTYFAYFGMALAVTVLFLAGRHFLSRHTILQNVFTLLFSCGLLVATVLIQFTNEQVMQDVRRANLRYTQAEKFLKKQKTNMDGETPVWAGRFQVTPTHTGKVICSDLHTGIDAYLGLEGIYETDYPIFHERYHGSGDIVTLFTCQQAGKSDDLYLMWFCCKGTDLTEDPTKIVCDSIIVGYYSAYKSFAISILSDQDSGTVLINGHPLLAQGNARYANIRFMNRPALQTFTLTGSRMLPATLAINDNLYPNITPIFFNDIPQGYLEDGIRYYRHDIWKHRNRESELDSIARQRGRDPQEFLDGNAEWLLFFNEQY